MENASKLYLWYQTVSQKRRYDPANRKDREEFKHFLMHHRWLSGICPFLLEWPYLTIPDMIKDKTTHYLLGVEKPTNF